MVRTRQAWLDIGIQYLLVASFFSTIFYDGRQTQPILDFVDQVSSATYQVRTLRTPIQNRIHDHGLVSCACSFAHFQVLLPVSNGVINHKPSFYFSTSSSY
jgi:hypothetical protein